MLRIRPIIVASCAALVLFGLTSCKNAEPRLTSIWPIGEQERVVPRPPAPLRYPYTGTKAKTRAAIVRRPISVKIENSSLSRPQTGISSADVVYETISEGGITRFNCIFHSKLPESVGPVRSARLSDLWVVPQYDALFFFSGASRKVNGRISKAKLPNLSEDAGVSRPYTRSTTRPAPHNLYLDMGKAYETAADKGYAIKSTSLEPLQYERRASDTSTETISEVTIPFSDQSTVRWVYDEESNTYRRFNNGQPHQDAGTGKQVSTENVVVLWADYVAEGRDKVGSTTYMINLHTNGRVSVFKNGRRYDGTWKATTTSPPRLMDKQRRPIRLAEGRTWFQVIPLKGMITMK